jgi:hypothetical protein
LRVCVVAVVLSKPRKLARVLRQHRELGVDVVGHVDVLRGEEIVPAHCLHVGEGGHCIDLGASGSHTGSRSGRDHHDRHLFIALGQHDNEFGQILGMMQIAVPPILVYYLLLQKQFARGSLSGSTKG